MSLGGEECGNFLKEFTEINDSLKKKKNYSYGKSKQYSYFNHKGQRHQFDGTIRDIITRQNRLGNLKDEKYKMVFEQLGDDSVFMRFGQKAIFQ